MFRLKPETAFSTAVLATSAFLLTPSAEALPLGYIEPYTNGQLQNNELVIDSGFKGDKPGIYSKIRPSKTSEIIIGLRQDGNRIIQASQDIKLSESVLIAPYIQNESRAIANNFVGLYGQLDILKSGSVKCNANGFVEAGYGNNVGYSGWRGGISCSFEPKQ